MSDVALPTKRWLSRYYLTRGLVAVAWVAAAFAFGRNNPTIAAILLTAYPAWDALANWIDAWQSGGLARNPSQTFNTVVSIVTALAVAVTVGWSASIVFIIFGCWAGLSGVLQLITGVRRWHSSGAQWAMILSGAQSALAGIFFVIQSRGPTPPINAVAPYASFGAFYFLLSAALLARRHAA